MCIEAKNADVADILPWSTPQHPAHMLARTTSPLWNAVNTPYNYGIGLLYIAPVVHVTSPDESM